MKKKLEDEDKRNEASGGIADGSGAGGVSGDGGDMEVEPWTTGTGEEPDNPFSKRSTKQKGHGKSKVTFENFEYIKVHNHSLSIQYILNIVRLFRFWEKALSAKSFCAGKKPPNICTR